VSPPDLTENADAMTIASRPPHLDAAAGPARLHLTLAISEYDHVRDLVDGTVQAAGIVLTPLTLPIEEIHYRFAAHAEFDIVEESLAKYVSVAADPDRAVVALPVFPSRVFRHSAIYVRRGSGVSDPRDLEGRRVGIPEWAQTAGVYLRGMLAEYYGVALEKVDWVQAGVNQPGRVEKARLSLPSELNYEPRPDSSLNDLLSAGEIDAILTARPPAAFLAGEPWVERMFPDYRAEEEAYFDATGIFPIMHVMAVRRSILDTFPWAARNLVTAFEAAKDAAVERLRDITASRVPLPWGAAAAEAMTQRFGTDLWPYGAEPNRPTLDAFCRFAHDQFLTDRVLTVEDLFPAELLSEYRV